MTGLDRLHGIAEDVGRTVWLRDLGAALSDTADAIEGGPRGLSGYESDVLAWVEENGGLEAVKERTMPEGMCWPVFEDGTPVKFGDVVSDGDETGRVYYVTFDTVNPVIIGFTDETPDRDPGTWLEVSVNDGERVKRPATKVLDADGVEIRVGDTVYYVDGREQKVNTVARLTDGLVQFGRINEAGYVTYCEGACISPDQLTHRAPVLAADGKPLREGETVWLQDGESFTVDFIRSDGNVAVRELSSGMYLRPERLTHERPDSLERIADDIAKMSASWKSWRLLGDAQREAARQVGAETMGAALDSLVRRAKKLAGVSE